MYTNTIDWNTIADSVRPKARSGVHIERLESEAVLFDEFSGTALKMNATALEVWRRCDGTRTTRKIAEGLVQLFDVDLSIALDDVEQLVASFCESGLLDQQECG